MPIASETFTRREALAGLGVGAAALVLPGCATTSRAAAATDPAALLDEIAYNLLAHEPERATTLGVDIGPYAALRGKLEDTSPDGQRAYADTLRADLARVRAVDTSALDPATRTSFEVVESAYASALDGFALPYGDVAVGSWRNTPYVVIQNVGAYIDYPRFLDSDHPVRDAADAEAYLSRRTAEANIAGDWAARARQIAAGPVAAALERQLAELRRQQPLGTDDAGMWARPRGDEWYAWGLRASTTTRMAPDEIHEMGLTQLDEIHGRMDPILRDLGYTQGTVGDRMTALSQDPRFKFAEGDPGRAEIMQFIQERIAWIRAQMPRAFTTVVRANLEVRRLPLAEEPGAPTAYGGAGSKDGTIPGKMWINLRTTDLHRKYDVPTLVHHETIPGHVWEGEYSNQLPLIRSILAFNAFSEGWALYAEQLADELGAYDENPAWRLGYLQDQAFRACRLVVDTGLHHKRWTREQGIRFFMERNGNKREQVESEVDRYCSWPGQACGYKVGHSEIVRQRTRAQQALGPAYDLRSFNDAVVKGGNAPLDVLAKTVDRYIASARG